MKSRLAGSRTRTTLGTLVAVVSLSLAHGVQAGEAAVAKKTAKTAAPAANIITTARPTMIRAEKKAAAVGRPVGAGKVNETIANDSATANLLRDAYGTLAAADHDYDGHRMKAMHEIEAAAKHVGVRLHGDGKDREVQGASDTLLRNAAGLLDQASAGLRGKSLEHVKLAYNQLDVALRIR